MIKKLTAWSFSRYNTYTECPLKAKLKFIDRIAEPGSPAMDRGSAIHKLAENYIKGLLKTLPPELKLFADEFKAHRKQYAKNDNGMACEDSWSFRVDWTETQWDDWAGCWLRVKVDLAHHLTDDVLIITDWKTGKFRPEMHAAYLEQLELYALAALLLHPHLKEVRPRLVYLDQGTIYPEQPLIFTPADVKRLKALWAKRTRAMMSDTIFAPRPNDKCRYCFFSASKNGPCSF